LVNTLSCRAEIFGTCIVIIADNWSMHTAYCDIASVNGACIVVVAVLWSVDTTFLRVATINSTFVFVSANNWCMLTLSGSGVTRVSCATIVVIAINWFLIKTFVKGTEPNLAFIRACCILSCKINWSVLASFYNIARVSCAWVTIITRNCVVVNDSGCSIAIVFGTCVVIINWLVGKDAS
jgi:hypothetical protein